LPQKIKFESFIKLIQNCHEIGFSIALKGKYSRFVAKILAHQLHNMGGDIVVIDIYPGTSRIEDSLFNNTATNTTFIFNNFDISPISVYGSQIIEDAYLSLHAKEIQTRKQLILISEETGLGLDFPDILNMFTLKIDTDQITDFPLPTDAINLNVESLEEGLEEYDDKVKSKLVLRSLNHRIDQTSFRDNPEAISHTLNLIQKTFFSNNL